MSATLCDEQRQRVLGLGLDAQRLCGFVAAWCNREVAACTLYSVCSGSRSAGRRLCILTCKLGQLKGWQGSVKVGSCELPPQLAIPAFRWWAFAPCLLQTVSTDGLLAVILCSWMRY